MLGKILIPMLNTDGGGYEYGRDISREEYDYMVGEEFRRNNYQMNRFVDNIRNHISNERYREVYDVDDRGDYPELLVNYSEAEAYIQDSKKGDIPEENIREYIENGKMFILIVNVNPNSLENDAESELRFWLDDSKKVHEDETLDDKTKLMALPKRDIKIKLGNETATMRNCKMLQDYGSKKYPFHFAFIIEKIVLDRR